MAVCSLFEALVWFLFIREGVGEDKFFRCGVIIGSNTRDRADVTERPVTRDHGNETERSRTTPGVTTTTSANPTTLPSCFVHDIGRVLSDGETHIYQNCSTTVMCYQGILYVDQNAGCPQYYTCGVEDGARGCYCNGSPECRLPYDCHEVGQGSSGVYTIQPRHWSGEPFEVYCDMEDDGGGWTVFQRRMNGNLSFYQNWTSYASGFGNLNDEFWLGNEKLHYVTKQGNYELKVELVSGEADAEVQSNARYDSFVVEGEAANYELSQLGTYEGDAGDAMEANEGEEFSTLDRDNDVADVLHCGRDWRGGWWYKRCGQSNLNGVFGDPVFNVRVHWTRDYAQSPIKRTLLKIRPKN